MSDVLTLSGLRKGYHLGQPNEIRVLDGADLTLKAGEIVGLIAPSGSGKSTLLHIAGLLDTPDEGEVRVMGKDMARASDKERTDLRRGTLGFVYQFHHLLPEFTAAENVVLPQLANATARGAAEDRAKGLLSAVGLADRANHRPAEMSGGEQQRTAIARALANAPKVLLADEPTGNLDPETSDRVFQALVTLVRGEGLAGLIATHNLELASRMDRVVRLEQGQIVAA